MTTDSKNLAPLGRILTDAGASRDGTTMAQYVSLLKQRGIGPDAEYKLGRGTVRFYDRDSVMELITEQKKAQAERLQAIAEVEAKRLATQSADATSMDELCVEVRSLWVAMRADHADQDKAIAALAQGLEKLQNQNRLLLQALEKVSAPVERLSAELCAPRPAVN